MPLSRGLSKIPFKIAIIADNISDISCSLAFVPICTIKGCPRRISFIIGKERARITAHISRADSSFKSALVIF